MKTGLALSLCLLTAIAFRWEESKAPPVLESRLNAAYSATAGYSSAFRHCAFEASKDNFSNGFVWQKLSDAFALAAPLSRGMESLAMMSFKNGADKTAAACGGLYPHQIDI